MDNPIFYDAVSKLYNLATKPLPPAVQEMEVSNAFILGFGFTYGIVRGLQWTSKKLMNHIIPNFDEKYLPFLEKSCITCITAAPLLYAMIDPEGAKEIMMQHPVYTSGLAGVYAGGVAGAAQDLHKRKINDLENKINDLENNDKDSKQLIRILMNH